MKMDINAMSKDLKTRSAGLILFGVLTAPTSIASEEKLKVAEF
jgi:hypothetical protein